MVTNVYDETYCFVFRVRDPSLRVHKFSKGLKVATEFSVSAGTEDQQILGATVQIWAHRPYPEDGGSGFLEMLGNP